MHPEDLQALMDGLKRQLMEVPETDGGERQEVERQEDFQEGDQ
jgi:hypothetical protein